MDRSTKNSFAHKIATVAAAVTVIGMFVLIVIRTKSIGANSGKCLHEYAIATTCTRLL